MNYKQYEQDRLKKQGLVFKQGYAQNVVSTTREQNLAVAKRCENYGKACVLFRALQYANNMGTTGADFDELEEHFPWTTGNRNTRDAQVCSP
jgi:predicted HNH restriction endonuclease